MKKRKNNVGEVYVHEPLLAPSGITELVFILDRSGSMAGLESDTVGGFNAMIEKQKKEVGRCFVSTVLFSDRSKVLHDRVRLEDVPKMTDDDYSVGGCTALIDAIGEAVKHIGNIHKYGRPEDRPDNTVFVITTDGYENASRRFSADEVRAMIEKRKTEDGWEFIFMGANIDAVETAKSFGISEENAVNYHADEKGTKLGYEAMGAAISSLRGNATLCGGWRKQIDEDFEKRKK